MDRWAFPCTLFISFNLTSLFSCGALSGERAIIAAFDISDTLLDGQSCFDYYNNAASFDSEAPRLLNALEDLQKADPETRLVQVMGKEQIITLSPAGK